MDEDLKNQLLSVREFYSHMGYEQEKKEVEQMMVNLITKKEADILDEYAEVMKELNDTAEEETYLREAYQGRWDRDSND